jgi:hypothetical protein
MGNNKLSLKENGNMNIKDYIKVYNDESENGLKEHIANGGKEVDYDGAGYIESEMAIVGYYLDTYKDKALSKWLENISYLKLKWGLDTPNKKVTEILKGLQ